MLKSVFANVSRILHRFGWHGTAHCMVKLYEYLGIWFTTRAYNKLLTFYRHYLVPDFVAVYDTELKRTVIVRILYHDAHYLIVNKPYDMNIDRGSSNRLRSSVDLDKPGRPSVDTVLLSAFPHYYLRNCHQIDYGTSGIFCIALHKRAARQMGSLFQRRLVKKTYVALVRGWIKLDSMTVDAPIGDDPDLLMSMKINGRHAKSAVTHIQVMQRSYLGHTPVTMVQLHPISGRRHQLRVHLSHIGYPIIGDLSYEQPVTPSFRMMLHAWRIEFHFDRLDQHIMPTLYRNWGDYFHHASRQLVSTPVIQPTLKLETDNPFVGLLTEQPVSRVYEEDLQTQRMDRYEWVQVNLGRYG